MKQMIIVRPFREDYLQCQLNENYLHLPTFHEKHTNFCFVDIVLFISDESISNIDPSKYSCYLFRLHQF